MVDVIRWGTAAVLLVAFGGALLVRDQPASEVATLPLPPICGTAQADAHAHAGHAGHGTSSAPSMQEQLDMMSVGADEAHAALIQTMEPMHSDMMQGMTAEDFEVAFVCSMVPHHQGAVEMARVAQQYSTDPWVMMFAQEIISSQEVEIREMQGWLSRRAAQ